MIRAYRVDRAARGNSRFGLPGEGDDRTPDACEDCGDVVGSMGELKQAFAEAVITKVRRPKVYKKARVDDA